MLYRNFFAFPLWKHVLRNARFQLFTAMKIQVEVFWVVTSYSVIVGYQRFKGPYCLHLQGLGRRHNPEDLDLFSINRQIDS